MSSHWRRSTLGSYDRPGWRRVPGGGEWTHVTPGTVEEGQNGDVGNLSVVYSYLKEED